MAQTPEHDPHQQEADGGGDERVRNEALYDAARASAAPPNST